MNSFIKILRIILVLFFFTWLIIWFSIGAGKKDKRERNSIEKTVVSFYEMPGTIRKYLFAKEEHLEKKISTDINAYQIGSLKDEENISENYYLLYYCYIGNDKGKVYLQGIKDGTIAYEWNIPLLEIHKDLTKISNNFAEMYAYGQISIDLSEKQARNTSAMRIQAPLMLDDSSLLFHSTYGYLYKINKHSEILWKSDKIAHHSIELDESGNIWTCSINLDNEFALKNNFQDDAIMCLNPDGSMRYFISLTNAFEKSGLFDVIADFPASPAGSPGLDLYHINDVLPVKKSGKYWEEGDVLISLNTVRIVAQYRPSNDSIIWYQKGPWIGQHDIQILNDSLLSVFNNNNCFIRDENTTSFLSYCCFTDNSINHEMQGYFTSGTEGRQTQTHLEDLFIEETNKSMYHFFDPERKAHIQFYIPYYKDSTHAHYPNWARVYFKTNSYFNLQ